MAARIVTVEPTIVSRATSRSSSRPSRRGADLIDRLNALENEKRSRRHSHAGSLVLARPGADRSVQDINDEIRALEAEKQAYRYENRASEERDLAYRYRERASSEAPRSRYGSERDLIIEEEYRRHRPEQDYIYEESRRTRSRPPAELVLYDREKYGPREVVYERAKSPPRNVVRVQKDRKGRMTLVRSTH
ncbi:hypothetical protein Slin15195_G120810 [Septoria linicola]|uniref:Uncharacterized protein n=1 Tax=Septoria linicola TaxID=215465 RepID=A0A9Q9AZB3_9PEZI|nr:hypothetical protein Slin14017_G097790 [Septoria linicola]USW58762.1 hypothetical protein Slin15195_G120810 [Septoria linicola]